MREAAENARIATARLVLRAPTRADFEPYAEMWADPRVTRHITGDGLSRETAWGKFLRDVGHWRLLGYGYWCILEAESGRFAGQIGFGDFKRDMTPSFGEAPEMGWSLAGWAQGKGYAREAGEAAMAWLDAAQGAPRMVCMIDDGNARSIRLAERLGFRAYAQAHYKAKAVTLFER